MMSRPARLSRDGEVWIKPSFGHVDALRHWRLASRSLAHDLGLVIAKAVRGQLHAGLPTREILRRAVLFAVQNRDGWGSPDHLTALGNLLAYRRNGDLSPLLQGTRRVAPDCDGEAPRRERAPLASGPISRPCSVGCGTHRRAPSRSRRAHAAYRHRKWRRAGRARNLLFAAATVAHSRTADIRSTSIKACECLDQIGWEHAAAVLPSVVGRTVAARRAEETTAWRHPVDLVTLCEESAAELQDLINTAGRSDPWSDHAKLAAALLGDDAGAILAALRAAVLAGASPPISAARSPMRRRCAWRVSAPRRACRLGDRPSRFHYANAIHQGLKRIGTDQNERNGAIEAMRGCFMVPWRLISPAISMSRRRGCQVKTAIASTTFRRKSKKSGLPC